MFERLEELTGTPITYPNRVGTLGRMEGVSFVALHFLLSMEDKICGSSRQALFDFLPDIAASTEEDDRQRAEMAARIACSELLPAALSATGRFPDEANRLLDSARSLDDMCADVKELRKAVEAILAEMSLSYLDESPPQGVVGEAKPDIEGPCDAEEDSNSGDDDDEDLIDLFPRTKSGIDHERLICVARVLESAIAAAEAVHSPPFCMRCVKSAMLFTGMIIETEQFTDITLRSMRRILDIQTQREDRLCP